jgi:hypothetical protein
MRQSLEQNVHNLPTCKSVCWRRHETTKIGRWNIKHEAHNYPNPYTNYSNLNPKEYIPLPKVYSKRGTWVVDKYPLPTFLVGFSTSTSYSLKFPEEQVWGRGRFLRNSHLPDSTYIYPVGGLEIFLVPAPTLTKPH